MVVALKIDEAIPRVFSEDWIYGFLFSLWSGSVLLPVAIHQVAWLSILWLFIHHLDSFDRQIVFHFDHAYTIWFGAILGWAFARFFRLPRFIHIDFHESPNETVFMLAMICTIYAGSFLMPIVGYVIPGPFPLDDATVRVVLGVSATLAIILLVQSISSLWRTRRGRSTLKYFVTVIILYWTGIFINETLLVFFLGTIAFNVAALLWDIYVLRRRDAFFPCTLANRTRSLVKFHTWILLLQLLFYFFAGRVANADCLAAFQAEDISLACDVQAAVRTAQLTALAIGGVFILLFAVLSCVYRGKRRACIPQFLRIESAGSPVGCGCAGAKKRRYSCGTCASARCGSALND